MKLPTGESRLDFLFSAKTNSESPIVVSSIQLIRVLNDILNPLRADKRLHGQGHLILEDIFGVMPPAFKQTCKDLTSCQERAAALRDYLLSNPHIAISFGPDGRLGLWQWVGSEKGQKSVINPGRYAIT